MAKPIITLLGLGLTGTSLGLALQRTATQAELVGHDKVPEAAQLARKANAIQRIEWNLHAACEPASMIILAMPLSEIGETLALIKDDLRPNTLVFIVTDMLQPAADMLKLNFGGYGYAVVGHPIINGVGGPSTPRADLFDNAVFVVAAGADTDPAALELASNFVESLEAVPLFMDSAEHDGIIAGVEQLPQLLGLAQMHMLAGGPGWTEARRLAGRAFAQSTDPGRTAAHLFTAMQANRENLLQRIDAFQRELAAWKQWLTTVEPDPAQNPLAIALDDTVAQRAEWETQAEMSNWDPSPRPEVEKQSSGIFRQMFLGNIGKKPDPNAKR